MNSYPVVRWLEMLSICHMMNIKFLEKNNGEFYHLKCYVLSAEYIVGVQLEMFPFWMFVFLVQGSITTHF